MSNNQIVQRITFKLQLCNTFKRVTLCEPVTFDSLLQSIQTDDVFGRQLRVEAKEYKLNENVLLYFFDDEHDKCQICNDAQLRDAIDLNGTSKSIKIILEGRDQSLDLVALDMSVNHEPIVLANFDQDQIISEEELNNILPTSSYNVTCENSCGLSMDQLSQKFPKVPEIKAIKKESDRLVGLLQEFKDNSEMKRTVVRQLHQRSTMSYNKMSLRHQGHAIEWTIIQSSGILLNPKFQCCTFVISVSKDISGGIGGLVAAFFQMPFTLLATICSTLFAFTPTDKYICANMETAQRACSKLGVDAFSLESEHGQVWKSIIYHRNLIKFNESNQAVITVD